MNEGIKRLLRLVSPPENYGVDPALLEEFRREGLPEDLVDFLRVYGPGQLERFMNVFMPGHPNEWIDSYRRTEVWVAGFKYMDDMRPLDLPPGLSSLDDLRAWASTDNGDMCFYVPPESGEDEYLVVLWGQGQWFVYSGSVGDFLADWMERKIAIPRLIFPESVPLRHHSFTPFVYAPAKYE